MASTHDRLASKGRSERWKRSSPSLPCSVHGTRHSARSLYQQLLDAIAAHRVADRPDRFEPRRVKRRPKRYDRLMKSRQETKRDILNGISDN